MGYTRHHAIIVTSFDEAAIKSAKEKAFALGLAVSGINTTKTNSIKTFVVFPDGSSEGWEASNIGDERRAKLKAFLRLKESWRLTWAEVQYGDDDGDDKVIATQRG